MDNKSGPREQQIVDALQRNWVWAPGWVDAPSPNINTAGRIARFRKHFHLECLPSIPTLVHCSADTRYKLWINGERVAVGPVRGSPALWYFDTINITPHLRIGVNRIECVVLRYFAANRAALPFHRTAFPGLTMAGSIVTADTTVPMDSRTGWLCAVENLILFPMGLADDVFLHINERIKPPKTPLLWQEPAPYEITTRNGELAPWRLRSHQIPPAEQRRTDISKIISCQSSIPAELWTRFLRGKCSLPLVAGSSHILELQAEHHSTAFVRWTFKAKADTTITFKTTYSEGYEQQPYDYPFFRQKADRLDSEKGSIIGPHDTITLHVAGDNECTYEPFWFRTFYVLRIELTAGPEPIDLVSLGVEQVNYPMHIRATWSTPHLRNSSRIWDISIRTMRNCMVDGYSDCPFYEQLQYSGDSRVVGLFHYLLSGDDRLMRQAISNFAASTTAEGLTQSRFPSQTAQIIAGFSLIWILQVCDHYLYFGDKLYARSFLPRIDGVLEYFASHVDDDGLVSGLPPDVWQYVDWVAAWGATPQHPDKGVPLSGRGTNRHTYFSMLYAHVLTKAAELCRTVERPGHATEYDRRAQTVVVALRRHCFDGRYFTDSTSDIADSNAYSQHCQVFAVLCGAIAPADAAEVLEGAFNDVAFYKCSYMMKHYALRAFAIAGDSVYEKLWQTVWNPWHKMIQNNMTTWEEDDVRQRSDCHAWGSIPIYEYCVELAGVKPTSPGCASILFKPRLRLTSELSATIALGKENTARVSWHAIPDAQTEVHLHLDTAIAVTSEIQNGGQVNHGVVTDLHFTLSENM